MIIEIYCDADYTYLPLLRKELKKALLQIGMPPCWVEYYRGWSNTPIRLKKTPQPCLLINHVVVWNNVAGVEEKIPSASDIYKLLMKPVKIKRVVRWKKILGTHLSFLMAVIIAFFPKCPFCWAAYMSMFSFLGINTISYQPWLLPVFIVLFFANLVSLYLSRNQHGYKLLLLSLAGALLIVLNRLYWNMPVLMYWGAGLLLIASLWNSLSKRMANSIKYYLFGRGFGKA